MQGRTQGIRRGIHAYRFKPVAIDFERTQGFLKRLFERPAYGHGLADRFHLRAEQIPGLGEFIKGETRHLDDHIVDRGFKRGRRLARNIIRNFVQGVAHGQLGGNFGNRKPGGFTRQRRRARHPRVHFNHHQPTGLRVDGKLDIGPTRVHPDFADDTQRRVPHELIFFVGQGLGRRNRNGITGMNAEGIEIFDGTDDDHIVLSVTHHFQFKLFPAGDRLFNQDLMRGRGLQAPLDNGLEFLRCLDDPAPGAPKSPRRPDDQRQA